MARRDPPAFHARHQSRPSGAGGRRRHHGRRRHSGGLSEPARWPRPAARRIPRGDRRTRGATDRRRARTRRAPQRGAPVPGRDAHFAAAGHAGDRRFAHRTRAETGPEIAMSVCPLPDIVFDGVIDVSHHNGAIDWPAVAGAGIILAFIKATQGTGFVDPAFARNRGAAAKAGVLIVPYHFIDTADADAQAAHFLDVTDLAAGDAAMLDWESAAPAGVVATLGQAVADCAGRAPIAYYGFAQLAEPDAALSRWPLMLPEYPRGAATGC